MTCLRVKIQSHEIPLIWNISRHYQTSLPSIPQAVSAVV